MKSMNFPRPKGPGVPCSRTANVFRIGCADEAFLAEYIADLEAVGYKRLSESTLPGGIFYVYTDGTAKLTVSLRHDHKELRVISEPMPKVPDFSKMGEKKFSAVTLTQFSTHSSHSEVCSTASGMGYVFRLTDGRLIVIDGGFHSPGFDNDYPEFLKLLREVSGEEKPRVAAWLITHCHLDHYGVLLQMKPEDADIDAYLFTFPQEGICDGACLDLINNLRDYEEKKLPLHAGDRYDFGDAVLDVYYTCEEAEMYDSMPMRNDGNNQSMIFSLTIEGQKIVFVGDAYNQAERLAVGMGKEALKADICQIGHHGRVPQRDDFFYEHVAPKVALWPACYAQIDHDHAKYGADTWVLGEKSTVVDHYVAYDGNATLTLPYTPKGLPYVPHTEQNENL